MLLFAPLLATVVAVTTLLMHSGALTDMWRTMFLHCMGSEIKKYYINTTEYGHVRVQPKPRRHLEADGTDALLYKCWLELEPPLDSDSEVEFDVGWTCRLGPGLVKPLFGNL